MCTIFENVWHRKISSVFNVSRVYGQWDFDALTTWSQDTGLSTGHARDAPHAMRNYSISRRMDIANRPSS